MNEPGPQGRPFQLDAEMLPGSPRIGPLLGLLRGLPAPMSRAILAMLAVGDGVLRRGRFRRAASWASAQQRGRLATLRIAIGLLANHGRFVAEEALIGMGDLQDLRRDTILEGAERLRNLGRGALLLTFHLGPPLAWLALRACGLNVRFAGGFEAVRDDPRWEATFKAGDAVRLSRKDPAERTRGLYRLRNLLNEGALVCMTADGPTGREALRLDLPGGPLIARSGWLALRRQTRVPAFPTLTYREGARRVIVIHPPLPEVDADIARDAEACRAALTPILADYVRRFPTQCRYLVFPSWKS